MNTALYILIVDDDSSLRRIINLSLTGLPGITLLDACDGRNAIEILEKYGDKICVLLTDHDMPHMTGDGLIAWTKNSFPKIKSILASGRLPEVEGLSEPDRSIAKPFTTSVIRMLVIDLIKEFKVEHGQIE